MDPAQTAPAGALKSGFTLFVKKASELLQQMTKADDL